MNVPLMCQCFLFSDETLEVGEHGPIETSATTERLADRRCASATFPVEMVEVVVQREVKPLFCS